MSIISKLFGDANQRYLNKIKTEVDEINKLEEKFELISLDEIKTKSAELKKKAVEGLSLDTLLPEAFALVREASKRTLGQRHFDVQLMGGIALHQGKIAEMKTGEGKTLVATLPTYLNALGGKGVHIVTVNDYLSRRDAVWMGQIYNALGLKVACINHEASYLYDPNHTENQNDNLKIKNGENNLDKIVDMQGAFRVVHEYLRPVERKEAYQADVVYGTNNEFGFDYLRDNMAYAPEQMSQRPARQSLGVGGEFNYAIVDEVDSILIDEARTPLIISAPDTESTKFYEIFAKIVPNLKENEDYNVDEKLKAVSLTDSGIEKVEKTLGIKNIYEEGGVRQVHHLEQALRAEVLFKKDKDYVVKDGQIIIVDEFTGRLMPGRRWSEGLHQAVEAKEGAQIQKESRTLATITFQNYFRLYKKLAGMTGTALTSAEEFHKVYTLDVVSIPTNKQLIRQDYNDKIYKTHSAKWKAVIEEIKSKHQKGQPVLVGTVSIEKNELVSAMLQREGIPHKVLNAKNHEQEAQIIAQAGKPGAVTVATNMAGRGVDIILGGNPSNPEGAQRTKDAGGLHVIGTERHEARRIDNQLRGRAGRQGDPGSTQFFISLEDDVVRVFGGDRIKGVLETFGFPEDEAIEHGMINRSIEQAQSKIEGHNFDIRKYVLEFDDVMNKHRETIYRLRRQILNPNEDPSSAKASEGTAKSKILEYLEEEIKNLVEIHSQTNPNEIYEALKAMVGKEPEKDKVTDLEYILDFVYKAYEEKEKDLGSDQMRQLEKILLLRTIDELWIDHLDAMENLRDSVNLRAYGQRDPLIEYKIEGQKLYDQLLNSIRFQVANLIFKVSLTPPVAQPVAINNPTPASDSGKKEIGRNDPCWCGSGKKFKKCHGK